MNAWQEAQAGLFRCASRRFRIVSPRISGESSGSGGTSFGAGGGGVPRIFSRMNLPRLTGDVRFGWEVKVRMLPWVRIPRRGVPARETRRNSSPSTPGSP